MFWENLLCRLFHYFSLGFPKINFGKLEPAKKFFTTQFLKLFFDSISYILRLPVGIIIFH